ncbi:hypothetical protein CYMTET_53441 [Cymbomonas tetramitiformis]|uniref:Uncharacterized protein n=1 Tax=Cymbomonas tetramitiformis TaxID=36881 RepID=A0AAE0BIB3_9CHLO|nr:hypothetical protein CYMTET_53441 [Cymbomonas tetramitiformis]
MEQREKAVDVLSTLSDVNQKEHKQAIAETDPLNFGAVDEKRHNCGGKGGGGGCLAEFKSWCWPGKNHHRGWRDTPAGSAVERRQCGGEEERSGRLAELECRGAGLEQAIAEPGTIPRPLLRDAVWRRSAEAKKNAVGALGNLSIGDGLEQSIADAGAIPPLVQLLSGDGIADAKEKAPAALWSLSRFVIKHGLQQAIADAGAIPPLVQLLRDGSAGVLRGNAAAALLQKLSIGDGLAQAVAEAGAIPLLAELPRDGSAAGAKENARSALLSFSSGDGLQRAIADAGAIHPLVQMLREGSGGGEGERSGCLTELELQL